MLLLVAFIALLGKANCGDVPAHLIPQYSIDVFSGQIDQIDSCNSVLPAHRVTCGEHYYDESPERYCFAKGCCYDENAPANKRCFQNPQKEGTEYRRVRSLLSEDSGDIARIVSGSNDITPQQTIFKSGTPWCHHSDHSDLTFDFLFEYPISKVEIFVESANILPKRIEFGVTSYNANDVVTNVKIFDDFPLTIGWNTLYIEELIENGRLWKIDFFGSDEMDFCVSDMQFYFEYNFDDLQVTGRSFYYEFTPSQDIYQRYILTVFDDDERLIFRPTVVTGFNLSAVMISGYNLIQGATRYEFSFKEIEDEDPEPERMPAVTHCSCDPTTTAAGPITTFLELGCFEYEESSMPTAITFTDNSNAVCSRYCAANFFGFSLYSMTIGERCICTLEPPSTPERTSVRCDTECPGNTGQQDFCGSVDPTQPLVTAMRSNANENMNFYIADPRHIPSQKTAGAPSFPVAEQKRGGVISLSWYDSSTCEDRFEYYMCDLDSDDDVCPPEINNPVRDWKNVFKYSKELSTTEQCGFLYNDVTLEEMVGAVSTDDELVWRFGEDYEMVLRTNVLRDQARQYVDYSQVTFPFRALWEAVLTGRVTSTGGNGVRGVLITAKLYNTTYETLTDSSGTYEIWLNGFYQEFEQSVIVTPYMETDGLVHEFTCGEQNQACEWIEHSLKHDTQLNTMQKTAQELPFVDLTVVDFMGVVEIWEPSDRDIACAEEEVHVCIYSIKPERLHDPEIDCVETQSDGSYLLQAPMSMDAIYHVNATYAEHEIMTVSDQTQRTYVYEGVIVHDFVNQNFVDLATRSVEVTVRGGTEICDTHVLDWLVAVSPTNCPEIVFYIDGAELGNGRTRNFNLGAQTYTFRLVGDDDFENRSRLPTDADGNEMETTYEVTEVAEYFQFYRPFKNLTLFDPDVTETVLFEYHIPATQELEVDSVPDFCIPDGFVYLEMMESYRSTLRVYERFGPATSQQCNNVNGNVTMYGMIQFGDDPPEGCADPMTGYTCQVPVTYDNTSDRAVANFMITPALPALSLHQMAFEFVADIDESADLEGIRIVEHFFVAGLRPISDALQVPFPEHMPLFILREPPGDGSSSSLMKNTKISLDIKISSHHKSEIESELDIGVGGDSSVDAGFGVIKNIFKAIIDATIAKNPEMSFSQVYSFTNSRSIDVTLQETFSSPGGGVPKDKCDMFLTPSFNIEFDYAQDFFLNDDCEPDMRPTFVWSLPEELEDFDETLPPNEHHPAANLFTWYSQQHIEEFKLPELRQMFNTSDEDCTRDCEDSTNPTQCLAQCPIKKAIIGDSIEGWEDLLEFNENLKIGATRVVHKDTLMGENSDLQRFIDSRVNNRLEIAPLIDQNFIGGRAGFGTLFGGTAGVALGLGALSAAPLLLVHSFASDLVFNTKDQIQDRVNDLAIDYPMTFGNTQRHGMPDDVHMMSFSGGGSSYQYSYTRASSDSSEWSGDKTSGSTPLKAGSNVYTSIAGIKAWVNLTSASSLELGIGKDSSLTNTDTMTSMFTLSDGDIGDEFTFELLEDAMGWLYFRTIGGKSSCPAEPNTISRDLVRGDIDLVRGPRHITNLQQDEVAIWVLRLFNESPTGERRSVQVSVRDNPNFLTLFANGMEFETNTRTFAINPFDEENLLITATRPAGTEFFFPVNITFSTPCDGSISDVEDISVTFAEDCPTAEFIFSDGKWLPTQDDEVLIIAYNEKWRTNPWRPVKPDQVLNIYVFYRMITPYGTAPPRDIFIEEPFDLNFAEDNVNGRTEFDWLTGNLDEGEFELYFMSECEGFAQNDARSPYWEGAIDHDPPVLVQFPEPQDGVWTVGDEVSFQFNEPIICEYTVEMHWKEDPDDEYDDGRQVDVQGLYAPVCPHDGEDGKIIFNVNSYLRDINPGKVYRIRVFGLSNKYNRVAPGFFTYEFLGEDPTIHFELSVDKRDYAEEEICDVIDLDTLQTLSSENVVVNGNKICADISSSESYGQIEIDLSESVEEGYLYELLYEISAGQEVDNEFTIALWSTNSQKRLIASHKNQDGEFIGHLKDCSITECKLTIEFLGASDINDLCIELKYAQWEVYSTPTWTNEFSRLANISNERISVTNVNNDADKYTLLSFSVSEHAKHFSDELRPHEVAKHLKHAISRTDLHADFHVVGLNSNSEIDTTMEKHPPVCDPSDYESPRILSSESGFYRSDDIRNEMMLRVVLRTSVLLPELQLAFVGADNEVARYDYTSKGISHGTPYWEVRVEDNCSRDFIFEISWEHFKEHDIGGLENYAEFMENALLRVSSKDSEFHDVTTLEIFVKFSDLLNDPVTCDGCTLLTTRCDGVPDVRDGRSVGVCNGKFSGEICEISCDPGFISDEDSHSSECLENGMWTPVGCREQYFPSPLGTYDEVYNYCSEHNGHLAIIHSHEQNNAVAKLCYAQKTMIAQSEIACYIGLNRFDKDTFVWVDGSTTENFSSWDNFQPSNGRVPQVSAVVIYGNKGKWDDYGHGEVEFLGICELGECYPHDDMFVNLPEEHIQYTICKKDDLEPLSKTVYMSDGCTKAQITPKSSEPIWNNDTTKYTLKREWNMRKISKFETKFIQEVVVNVVEC